MTASDPGAPTVGGAVTVAPERGFCTVTDTLHVPAPPPASLSATELTPPLRGSVSVEGFAKSSGVFALGRSMRPPPSRSTDTSRPSLPRTGDPVITSDDLTCANVQSGCCSRSSAIAPAPWGVAMLVPSSCPHGPPSLVGSDEVIATPGAETSGLRICDTGVGPPDEKSAIVPSSVVAATAIAPEAFEGDPIEPLPNSLKSLPAATTGTTPTREAAFSAATTRSRVGSTSGSPSERLITFIPSATAASTAAASSAALPSSSNSGVGTDSAL